MLLLFACITIFAIAWIYVDAGTGDIFDVYGRHWRLAWQMRAWRAFASAGLRLTILLLVIATNVWIAFRINGDNSRNWQFNASLSALVIATSLLLIPWIHICRLIRTRRWLVYVATRFRDATARFDTNPDLTECLQPAEYDTTDEWAAWHPRDDIYELDETQELWSGTVPVMYTTLSIPRTFVVPIDWETFCVWGSPAGFAVQGHDLPFRGPGGTSFQVKAVKPLTNVSECWTIHTDINV